MMTVEINVTIDVSKSGQVRIRHEIDGLDPIKDDGRMFASMTDAQRKMVCDALPKWIRERFLLEAQTAVKAAEEKAEFEDFKKNKDK